MTAMVYVNAHVSFKVVFHHVPNTNFTDSRGKKKPEGIASDEHFCLLLELDADACDGWFILQGQSLPYANILNPACIQG